MIRKRYFKPVTALQRDCLIQATIADLIPFRRGFARTKAGPFFHGQTVENLIARGWLRKQFNGNRSRVWLTARSARHEQAA